MNILQVSTADIAGGAEKVACNLFNTYRTRGYSSTLAVGFKRSADPDVLEIPRPQQSLPWTRACWALHGRLERYEVQSPAVRRLRYWLRVMALGLPEIERELGYEDFNFPGSHRLLRLMPSHPDIIHAHNLHGNYFDLRSLPRLCREIPVLLTLHDSWLLAGHCAHSFDCDRWKTGCGQCPFLDIYSPIRRDAAAHNWQRKQRIFAKCRLYIATPSQWLMRKVEQSILAPSIIASQVIPNGVDLNVFCPADKQSAREALCIATKPKLVLFVANRMRQNIYKDWNTIQEAITLISERFENQRIQFIGLGEEAPSQWIGGNELRLIPYESNERMVARYYQAADIYIHAAKADTFPNTVLEALACGTPVVATAVGGIPEQIRDGETGFLTPPGDATAMATRIQQLLSDNALREQMGWRASAAARTRFDLNRQANEFLDWYAEICERNHCASYDE